MRLAFYLATGCMGCEMAFVDTLHEVIDEFSKIEIVWSSPMFKSSRYSELEEIEDNYIDYAIIEGGIGNSEVEYVVKMLRKKSRKIIALGTCAVHGGIPVLSHFHSIDEIIDEIYRGYRPSAKTILGGKYLLKLSDYRKQVPLCHVVKVDHYLPGCPPKPDAVASLIMNLENLESEWIISGKSVCSFCERSSSLLKSYTGENVDKRDENCFLLEGEICMGAVTNGDCMADCLKANVPCFGCYGPLPEIDDAGAKMIDVISAVTSQELVDRIFQTHRKFGKRFYLYSTGILKGGD